MYIMNDIKLVIILVLCLVILVMLFFNTKQNKVKKEVVYVQNNPLPLWYYRKGPIWRPPFRHRRRFR